MKKFYMDCGKIYHTTLIVCVPYFVNLNNNTSVKNTIILCSFTFIAKENRRSHLQLFV